MELYGADPDLQKVSDFPVGKAAAHQLQDFIFSSRRRLPSAGIFAQNAAHFCQKIMQHLRRDLKVAGSNEENRAHERAGHIGVWNIAVSAHEEKSHDLLS